MSYNVKFVLLCGISTFMLLWLPASLWFPENGFSLHPPSSALFEIAGLLVTTYYAVTVCLQAVAGIQGPVFSRYHIVILISIPLFYAYISIFLFAIIYRHCGIVNTLDRSADFYPGDYLYFSIATWTTTGYGDMVPLPGCRGYASLEQLMGWFVASVLIAILVTASHRWTSLTQPPRFNEP